MRIAIDDIPDEGLDVTATQADPWLDAAARVALEGAIPEAQVDLHIDLLGETLRVRGLVEATVTRDCDRCGRPLALHVEGDTDLFYHPAKREEDEAPHELHKDELDIGWYDGVELDLGDVVSEQLALWLPERVRCVDEDVVTTGDPVQCVLPETPEPPTPDTHRPFANLKLPR